MNRADQNLAIYENQNYKFKNHRHMKRNTCASKFTTQTQAQAEEQSHTPTLPARQR